MDELQGLKNRFEKQMKKQRYDNSGGKHDFIEIADKLFKIVEEQQEEIKKLKADKQVLSHYKYMYEQAKQ